MKEIFFSFVGSALVICTLYFLYWLSVQLSTKSQAYAECWWLPGWNCFRYVIRNIPNENSLMSIKYRSWFRKVLDPRPGSSVKTLVDTDISCGERIVLPGKQDLPVLCFRFERQGEKLKFIHTDKSGNPFQMYDIEPDLDSLMLEYNLKIQAWYLFKHDVFRLFIIPRRVQVKLKGDVDLFEYLLSCQGDSERKIPLVFRAAEEITVSV